MDIAELAGKIINMLKFDDREPFFRDEDSALYLCDAFDALEGMSAGSVDMIFADPPYFLPG